MSWTPHLTATDVADVRALASAAGDADGAYPLSEHISLHIRHGGDDPAVHLLARDPAGRLVGYAHVDTTDEVEGAAAELVVHPMHRRRGLGRALVDAAIAVADERRTAGGGRLRLWAHGDHPSANALALSMGFERARVLWQMRRSLYAPIPEPKLPEGVTVRPFRPGKDDEAWVAVNNRAFAGHPDQGRWTLHDLHVRMAEPWFDPAGFLLAEGERNSQHSLPAEGERNSQHSLPAEGERNNLLGFHWTKVHGDVRADPAHADDPGHADDPVHPHDPIGEVYVLGVDPAAHGLGLGTSLTVAGLRYLRGRGLDQAMLYVDESNTRAVELYTRLGFARWSTDVSFRRS